MRVQFHKILHVAVLVLADIGVRLQEREGVGRGKDALACPPDLTLPSSAIAAASLTAERVQSGR